MCDPASSMRATQQRTCAFCGTTLGATAAAAVLSVCTPSLFLSPFPHCVSHLLCVRCHTHTLSDSATTGHAPRACRVRPRSLGAPTAAWSARCAAASPPRPQKRNQRARATGTRQTPRGVRGTRAWGCVRTASATASRCARCAPPCTGALAAALFRRCAPSVTPPPSETPSQPPPTATAAEPAPSEAAPEAESQHPRPRAHKRPRRGFV